MPIRVALLARAVSNVVTTRDAVMAGLVPAVHVFLERTQRVARAPRIKSAGFARHARSALLLIFRLWPAWWYLRGA